VLSAGAALHWSVLEQSCNKQEHNQDCGGRFHVTVEVVV
jgi:hypothetical protein